MNVEEIAQAMVDLAQKKEMRLQMGENGYRRVMAKYRIEYMQETYWKIYRDFAKSMNLEWNEEVVTVPDIEQEPAERGR